MALTSSTAAVLERHAYTPYGVSEGAGGSAPWRYTGRRLDPDTGLYYLRARDYAPLIGRFLQPDPIGTAGGLNLYAYVENDPLNKTDPSGLWTIQVGGSFYFTLGPFSFQFSGGVSADFRGNAGFYGTLGGGAAVGAGLRLGVSAAVTNAPSIFDLQGDAANVSVTGGIGVAGSLDAARFVSDGVEYKSVGASVGLGGGASLSAGPSRTILYPQVVWDRPTGATPSQSAGGLVLSPYGLVGSNISPTLAPGRVSPQGSSVLGSDV